MEKGTKKSLKVPNDELFHVIHKVPSGDSPYVRAKHAQLVEKDPEAAIVLFWKAINAGDRVDSALKDMAVVMKQLDRTEEAIEAIKSFRFLCSKQAQESLDNVLIDLYKKCGKVEEQIELLKRKLRMIYQGEVFNGRPTKTARSRGKKFQVSVKQETSRLLGNLGWAYMQKSNFMKAEAVYRKAQMIDPDTKKACNLGLCLIKQARYSDARSVLEDITESRLPGSDDTKSRKRAEDLLTELRSRQPQITESLDLLGLNLDDDFVNGLRPLMDERGPFISKRLPIFEEISSFRDQLACAAYRSFQKTLVLIIFMIVLYILGKISTKKMDEKACEFQSVGRYPRVFINFMKQLFIKTLETFTFLGHTRYCGDEENSSSDHSVVVKQEVSSDKVGDMDQPGDEENISYDHSVAVKQEVSSDKAGDMDQAGDEDEEKSGSFQANKKTKKMVSIKEEVEDIDLIVKQRRKLEKASRKLSSSFDLLVNDNEPVMRLRSILKMGSDKDDKFKTFPNCTNQDG